jgi:hypothetical protein
MEFSMDFTDSCRPDTKDEKKDISACATRGRVAGKATAAASSDAEPLVPDDPGIGAFDGLGADEDETPPSSKKSWMNF